MPSAVPHTHMLPARHGYSEKIRKSKPQSWGTDRISQHMRDWMSCVTWSLPERKAIAPANAHLREAAENSRGAIRAECAGSTLQPSSYRQRQLPPLNSREQAIPVDARAIGGRPQRNVAEPKTPRVSMDRGMGREVYQHLFNRRNQYRCLTDGYRLCASPKRAGRYDS